MSEALAVDAHTVEVAASSPQAVAQATSNVWEALQEQAVRPFQLRVSDLSRLVAKSIAAPAMGVGISLAPGQAATRPFRLSFKDAFSAGITVDVRGLPSLSASYGPPAWIATVAQHLGDVLALPPNWDSYGSRTPQVPAALEALNFLLRVMGPNTPLPAVVPLSDGGIQLEWHRRGLDVEAIFGPVPDRGLHVWNRGEGRAEWDGPSDEGWTALGLSRRLAGEFPTRA